MSSTTILDSAENILSLLREYTASVCLFFNNDPTCANNHWSQQKKGRRRGQKSSPVVTQGRASEPEHQPVTAQESATGGPCWLGWRWCCLRKELCWDRKATQWDRDPHKEAPGMSNSPTRSTLVQSGHPDMAAVCREEKACTKGDWTQIYLEDNGRHISHY